jgi:hypothetical protein
VIVFPAVKIKDTHVSSYSTHDGQVVLVYNLLHFLNATKVSEHVSVVVMRKAKKKKAKKRQKRQKKENARISHVWI